MAKHPLEEAIDKCRSLASAADDRHIEGNEIGDLTVMLMRMRTNYATPEPLIPNKVDAKQWAHINDFVRVNLTEQGVAVVRKHFADLGVSKDLAEEFIASKLQSDGRYRFQVWSLMNIFGPVMYMASPIDAFSPAMFEFAEE